MQRGQTVLPKSMRQANHIPHWTTSPVLKGKMNVKKDSPRKGNLGLNQIEAETAKVDRDFWGSLWVFCLFCKKNASYFLIRLRTDCHLFRLSPITCHAASSIHFHFRSHQLLARSLLLSPISLTFQLQHFMFSSSEIYPLLMKSVVSIFLRRS